MRFQPSLLLASTLLVAGSMLPLALPAGATDSTTLTTTSANAIATSAHARRSRNPYRGSGRRDFVRVLAINVAQ